jgi:hypothetical protein
VLLAVARDAGLLVRVPEPNAGHTLADPRLQSLFRVRRVDGSRTAGTAPTTSSPWCCPTVWPSCGSSSPRTSSAGRCRDRRGPHPTGAGRECRVRRGRSCGSRGSGRLPERTAGGRRPGARCPGSAPPSQSARGR